MNYKNNINIILVSLDSLSAQKYAEVFLELLLKISKYSSFQGLFNQDMNFFRKPRVNWQGMDIYSIFPC